MIEAKSIGLSLLLVGIVFIVESLVVMYVLGLLPAAFISQETSQFMTIAWAYSLLKLITGVVALVSGAVLLLRK